MDLRDTAAVEAEMNQRTSRSSFDDLFSNTIFSNPDCPVAISSTEDEYAVVDKMKPHRRAPPNQVRQYDYRATNLQKNGQSSSTSSTLSISRFFSTTAVPANGKSNEGNHAKMKSNGTRTFGPVISKTMTKPLQSVSDTKDKPVKKYSLDGFSKEYEKRRKAEPLAEKDEIIETGSSDDFQPLTLCKTDEKKRLLQNSKIARKRNAPLNRSSSRTGQDLFEVSVSLPELIEPAEYAPSKKAEKSAAVNKLSSHLRARSFGDDNAAATAAIDEETGRLAKRANLSRKSFAKDPLDSFRIRHFAIGAHSITRPTGQTWRLSFADNMLHVFRNTDEAAWFSFTPIRLELQDAQAYSLMVFAAAPSGEIIKGLEEYTGHGGAIEVELPFTFFCESIKSVVWAAKQINNQLPSLQVRLIDDSVEAQAVSRLRESLMTTGGVKNLPTNTYATRRMTRRQSAPVLPIEIDLLNDDDDEVDRGGNGPKISSSQHENVDANGSEDALLDVQAVRRVAKREMQFTYPFDGLVHSITLSAADQERLNEGEMLNDNLIEFYLRYIYDKKFRDDIRQRVFVFNTFFFKKLTTSIPGKLQTPHERVRKWTKNVDLFQSDFILIPINEHLHWYCALVCYPSRSLMVKPLESGTDNQNSSSETCSLNSSPVSGKMTPAKRSNQKSQNSSTEDCYILIFDSLGIGRRAHAIKQIKGYLATEAKVKRPEMRFDPQRVVGLHVKAPVQPNHTDCGVYLLHYMERFFTEDPDATFLRCVEKSNDIKNWFDSKDILEKRLTFWELMDRLNFEYRRFRAQQQ